MTAVAEGALTIAIVYWPVPIILGLGLFWAHRTKFTRLRKLLRAVLVFWALALLLMNITFLAIDATCEGNALYGYHSCQLVPTKLANAALGIWLLAHAIAALSTLLLFIGGAITEWHSRLPG